MLTKSEVIASLNEAVKAHLVTTAHNVMVDAGHVNIAISRYVAGLRQCREFHAHALKAIEEEFKE